MAQHRSARSKKARRAFEEQDAQESKRIHRDQTLAEAIHKTAGGRYIRDLVYGGLDGIVSTFAVVAAVTGAALSVGVVLILGFANLVGDGFSMATGNYLGTKSELEYQRKERQREEWETIHLPDEEREEIRQLYRDKGFNGKDLEKAVEIITSERKVWVDTMMLEELNIVPEEKSPFRSGLATYAAFLLVGFVPLSPYLLLYLLPATGLDLFPASIFMTALALFAVGSARTYVTGKRWWLAGIEMTLVGGAAAAAAYFVGYLLKGLGVG